MSGLVHITGGGFIDNIPRILHDPCRAIIERNSWPIPPIFQIIQDIGKIEESEMCRVFNMGIGMIVVVHDEDADDALERLNLLGEKAFFIGTVAQRSETEQPVVFI